MKNTTLLIFFLLAGFRQGAAQFTVRLVVDNDAKQLLVQIKNTVADVPTTSQNISSINMKLNGSGVAQIVSVSSGYTMQLPASGIITMSSTSLPSPENWMQNQYVTVATYGLNPGMSYSASDFSVQPDLDGDNSDVDDPIMSVQAAGFFNISLVIEDSTPLPVELVSFAVEVKEDNALLRWLTATEHNNEGFEVQRSTDGIHFENIGWVDGFGNSQVAHQYGFKDHGLSFGITYYRLKQVDYDGRFKYSPTRTATITESFAEITVHPNPTDGFLYFSFPAEHKGLTFSLFNAGGELVSQQTIYQNRLDLSGFPAGLYFISVDNGRRRDLIRVVKR